MDRRGLVVGAVLLLAMFAAVALLRPGAEPIRWDAFGDGSWSGARTANGGHDVIVVFIGGPEYDPGDPCSDAYHVKVTETPSEVRLRIGASSPRDRRPPLPPGSGYGCTAKGYDRTVTAHLARPLGGRKLIEEQFQRQQPVYDGDLLATPTWLPVGWNFRREGGTPDLGSREAISSWSRFYSPDRPPPEQDRCTPADPGFTLAQSPTEWHSAEAGEIHDVHGSRAVYSVDSRNGWVSARLSWDERGQWFVVESMPGCVGAVPTSKETMLRFARSLSVP